MVDLIECVLHLLQVEYAIPQVSGSLHVCAVIGEYFLQQY
jgi:hypothetical protein